MGICFCSTGGDAFPPDCDEHSGIVRLIAEGAGLAILDSKIWPVILDPECERRAGYLSIALEIFCNIEAGLAGTQGNDNSTFVSVLRWQQSHLGAGNSSLANATNLFVRRFAK